MMIAKQPDLGSALFRRDYQRVGRVLACSALLSSMLLVGFASNAAAAEKRARSSTTPARAEANGGNPQFYEVFGKRYRVRASSDGYRERGVASWYGRPFHGRPTSSGEMYDMHEMTAAHTSLPLPTWAEVTNLSNGKSVIVKINDRGPFVGERLIDLSHAAASALDIVGSGTARVEVRALDGPPQATAGRRGNRGQATTSADARVKDAEPVKAAEPVGLRSAPSRESRPDSPRQAAVRPATPTPTHDGEAIRAGRQVHEARRRGPARRQAEGARFCERVRRDRRRSPQIVASGARRTTARCGGGRTRE